MALDQFAFRTAQTIGLTQGPPDYSALQEFQRPEGNLRCSTYSPDGKLFSYASQDKVIVVDASTGQILHVLQLPNVYELSFSPGSKFLQTWERPFKEEDGSGGKNHKVWSTSDASQKGSFTTKSQSNWALQYFSDESISARLVTNEIQFYDPPDSFQSPAYHLRVEGAADFRVSSGSDKNVAVFVPERKGQPACAKIYKIPNILNPIAQKIFFKADKITFKWNIAGTDLLVLSSTEVDKTNKSYYGETNLYLLSTNGSSVHVSLDKEGPIHDVAFHPSSKEFGVVYGFIPAKTTVFNLRGEAIATLPTGPRNTLKYDPWGRFLLLGGFGNLAGQMDIFESQDGKGKKEWKKITTIEASNSSVVEWSADGRFILTGTTSPRLRVDNMVRLWHVSGVLVYKEEFAELFQVLWRPQPRELFSRPSNPLSPPSKIHSSAEGFSAGGMAANGSPAKPTGAYRPPGARGNAPSMAYMREDNFVNGGADGFGRENSGSPFGKIYVPGLGLVEDKPSSGKTGKAKNRVRAGRVKELDVSDNKIVASATSTTKSSPPQQSVVEGKPSSDSVDIMEKKRRALQKKLRAIEELKLKQAGGAQLEKTQEQKIAKEDEIVKELESLGWE